MDHQDFFSPQRRRLAYRYTAPRTELTFVWLSGFKSDMSGSKVTVLEAWAKAQGHGFGDVKLAVAGLNVASPSAFGMSLQDVSFDVRAGAVLGIRGVAGTGPDESLAAPSGEAPCGPGMVTFDRPYLTGPRPPARG